MKELAPINRNPLNQKSKRHLADLGLPQSREVPYSVQLLLWALENDPSRLPSDLREDRDQLLENLIDRLHLPPSLLQEWLLDLKEEESVQEACSQLARRSNSLPALLANLANNLYENSLRQSPRIE